MSQAVRKKNKTSFEGKRKQLENEMLSRLSTKNNYASLHKRLFAFLLDYFLSSIFVSMIPMIITSIFTQETSFTIETFTVLPMIWQFSCCVIAILAAIYYFCIFPINKGHRGQTIGKRLMKIKVTNRDGEDINYKNLLRRELLGSLIIEGETAFPSAFLRYFIYMLFPTGVASVLSNISIALSVISILWAVFDRQHLMIHDRIGETIVVNE